MRSDLAWLRAELVRALDFDGRRLREAVEALIRRLDGLYHTARLTKSTKKMRDPPRPNEVLDVPVSRTRNPKSNTLNDLHRAEGTEQHGKQQTAAADEA